MHRVLQLVKDMAKKSLERDRASEQYVEVVSRFLWPWRESWLLLLVGLLAILDYISTYTLLKLSGKMAIYEGGALASRALQIDGFRGLFLMNITAVSALSLTAVTTRFLYTKFGFKGFGRTAFVILLVPYAVVAAAAIINNLLILFL